MFEQLLRQLWRGILIEATLGDSVAGAAAARPFPASRHRTATREEAAVQRWLQALQVRASSGIPSFAGRAIFQESSGFAALKGV